MSIVTFQEQAQGALAYLSRARKDDQIVIAYTRLETVWRWFLKMNVLSFTAEARPVSRRSNRSAGG
jgi:hypothetical protein